MKHILDRAGDRKGVIYILAFETEFRIRFEMRKVRFVPGDQIIDRQNFPALGQQPIAKVRSEESCSSRNHCSHAVSPRKPETSIVACQSRHFLSRTFRVSLTRTGVRVTMRDDAGISPSHHTSESLPAATPTVDHPAGTGAVLPRSGVLPCWSVA